MTSTRPSYRRTAAAPLRACVSRPGAGVHTPVCAAVTRADVNRAPASISSSADRTARRRFMGRAPGYADELSNRGATCLRDLSQDESADFQDESRARGSFPDRRDAPRPDVVLGATRLLR